MLSDNTDRRKLDGKVAIITGSSRGIGRATALLFAAEGARVVVNYKTSNREAAEVVDLVRSRGGSAISVCGDIADPEQVTKLFQAAVDTFGTLDVLVNNAGICRPKPFPELTRDDLNQIFDVNIMGELWCALQASRIMIPKQSGKIIMVGSISGLKNFGTLGNIAYALSKSAVVSATGILAKAFAPNVTVNCVCPGFVKTQMPISPEYEAIAVTHSPLQRLLDPAEVASICAFLASEESSSMTGEVLVADACFQLK